MDATPDDIRRELSPGEQVLWTGRPRQGLVFRVSDALLIPFSLMWGGFAILWMSAAWKSGPLFALFGLPFVSFGLYLIGGRFFVEARQRARTTYAITNERAIVVSGVFGRTVKSLALSGLTDITLSETRSGEGSISFGAPNPFYAVAAKMPQWPGVAQGPSFDLIADVRTPYDILRRAQAQLSSRRA